MRVLVVGMRVTCGMVVMRMTVCRAILMDMPVLVTMFVAVFVHGLAFDARFTGRAAACRTHPSISSSVLRCLCSNRLRVL